MLQVKYAAKMLKTSLPLDVRLGSQQKSRLSLRRCGAVRAHGGGIAGVNGNHAAGTRAIRSANVVVGKRAHRAHVERQ